MAPSPAAPKTFAPWDRKSRLFISSCSGKKMVFLALLSEDPALLGVSAPYPGHRPAIIDNVREDCPCLDSRLS